MQQHSFQIQQHQQQPTLMSLPGFQQVAQQTLDAIQQVDFVFFLIELILNQYWLIICQQLQLPYRIQSSAKTVLL